MISESIIEFSIFRNGIFICERCSRSGGPSSSEASGGPSSAKSGEPGMNNQAPAGTSHQPGSSSGTNREGEGGGSGPGSLGGSAASSAFSRGLATLGMLTGETDADESEMGRLQALLEVLIKPCNLSYFFIVLKRFFTIIIIPVKSI